MPNTCRTTYSLAPPGNAPLFSLMPRSTPLVSLGMAPPSRHPYVDDEDDEDDTSSVKWYYYLPLAWAVLLMLAPHPSLLIVLVNYHYRMFHSPTRLVVHLAVTYTLSFLAFSSLIVVVARDPGSITAEPRAAANEDVSFMEALLSPEESQDEPRKWCRKCAAPKPERAHHCSACRRCILKMDHHCAWLGYKCIGHRTHTSFIHLLTCISALAAYIAVLDASVVYYAFTNPLSIDETTPLHALFLTFFGLVVSLTIGSFWLYHLYLISTNQTTLENLSPYLLLRYLPHLPPDSGLSNPPLEHELSHAQRRLVRDASHDIRMYDVGWRQNWAQVFGWDRPWGWVRRIALGGGGKGSGKSFPHNPRADELLARLAAALVDVAKDR
ncbi:zf-DHHC-domain-containing protein [Amylocystis lapponica]|nr:zf-DHHC-domain-containing protein [Amylocystis lapponica]